MISIVHPTSIMSFLQIVLVIGLLFVSIYFIVRIMQIIKQLRKASEEVSDLIGRMQQQPIRQVVAQ